MTNKIVKAQLPPHETSEAKRAVRLTPNGVGWRITAWAAFVVPMVFMGSYAVRNILSDLRDGQNDQVVGTIVMMAISAMICGTPPAIIEKKIRQSTQFLRDGREVWGLIRSLEPRRSDGFIVRYAFQVDGKEWSGVEVIGAADEPQIGQPLRILYLPEQPKKNTPVAAIYLVTRA